jgi:hypothetical protein
MSTQLLSPAGHRLAAALKSRDSNKIRASFRRAIQEGCFAEDFAEHDFSHLGATFAPIVHEVVDNAGWRRFEGFNVAGPWLQRLGADVKPELLRWAIDLALGQEDELSEQNLRIAAEFCRRVGDTEGLWQVFLKMESLLLAAPVPV